MKELKDIVEAYEAAENDHKQTALATVVQLEGSAYRRPGARMLVTEDGTLTGAISGGCLEGDALRKAQLVMVQKKPMLVTYDTTDEDDAKLGVGLGCNGIISILIEPIHAADENNPIAFLRAVLAKPQPFVLVTLFSLDKKQPQPGTCALFTREGEIKNSLPDEFLQNLLFTDATGVFQNQTSITKMYNPESGLTGFVEMIAPPPSIIIFGAGNDSVPLVQMANLLGWETTVVDGRPNYANTQRFHFARRILVSKPAEAFSKLVFDSNTAAVLMTHNYNYDIAALRNLITLPIPYIGALGPRKKLERMLDELKDEGVTITDESKLKLFGPAGLDVGAETAAEIALSIIAEIKAVLSKSTGTSLREKETIHPRESQQVIQAHPLI